MFIIMIKFLTMKSLSKYLRFLLLAVLVSVTGCEAINSQGANSEEKVKSMLKNVYEEYARILSNH